MKKNTKKISVAIVTILGLFSFMAAGKAELERQEQIDSLVQQIESLQNKTLALQRMQW